MTKLRNFKSKLVVPTADEVGIDEKYREQYNIFVAKFMLKDKKSVSFTIDKRYKIMIKMSKVVIKERVKEGVETRIYRIGRLICKKTNWDKITLYFNRSNNIYKKMQQFKDLSVDPKSWMQVTEYFKNGKKKSEYCIRWNLFNSIDTVNKKIGECIDYDSDGIVIRHVLYLSVGEIIKITEANKKTLMVRHPVPFLQ
jgi:hypothetical protein